MEANGLLTASPQHCSRPQYAPTGDSGWRKAGYCAYVIKVHLEGMILLSPDSCIYICILSYTQKSAKLVNLGYQAFFS